ncbi:MAG TPA: hypothetical protein VNX15_09900, partial [Gemmatimonadales bacterium]|nr:hypothetical protein [Gemmatimonadales bacterium]
MGRKDDVRDRDWDKELAEVDRLLNNIPGHVPAPPPVRAPGGARPAGAPAAGPRKLSTREWVG